MITFLVGVLRHYLSTIISSQKKVELQQVQDSQALVRSRLLRENGKHLPKQAFLMRRHFFNSEDVGYFKTQKRPAPANNPMTDPNAMSDMVKGNFTNVLPMIIIGGWINWAFSGFVTTKVPFPLTLRFKPMLQRGVELVSLDASWVSSASWYFLNVFGLRSIYSLVLGADNSADQATAMQEQFSSAGVQQGQDMNKLFKAEWEALEVCNHEFALEHVEEELLRGWHIPDRYITGSVRPSYPM